MSDPGFPPFRSAPPKGQRREAALERPPVEVLTDRDAQLPGGEVAQQELARMKALRQAEVNALVRHVTVCAKCGSREVREAVLIGDEVYVKL
jgi:hypothetical protein